jgi:16S rRNA (guanine527-N7)-methyltransferase
VIDIGTGAGFPGLPIAIRSCGTRYAIAQPNWHITLLDSTRKKIAFIETLLSQLEIENASTLIGRAEEVGQQPQHRQAYDIALVRAVAPASVCAEYALPLLKLGGLAILYRGQWTVDETKALEPAVENLGGEIESVEEFTTPVSHSRRACLYIRKVATTPAEFPRAVGLAVQKPL